MPTDTIAAVSTPAGVGGVAILRLSGPDALRIALSILDPHTPLRPRRASLRNIAGLDQGLATFFPAPHSYSGEDTVELACHGSLYLQQALLQALLDAGARLAEPGEFTRRAFANGRLNLAQAEAVADLINAATPAQHRLATSQLRGGYALKLKNLRQQLLELTALLELELDFSQEDLQFADRPHLRSLVASLQQEVASLLESFALGNALKQGIPVALVGETNMGKSTLLNALLQDDRAIVSHLPGTTRDTIEGLLTIDGIPFRIIDTAGLRSTDDEIELQGIMRSKKARDEAAIIVDVRDASLPGDLLSHTLHNDGKKHIRVLNKCDLAPQALPLSGQRRGDTLILSLSAKTGQGIDQLRQALRQAVTLDDASDSLLSNIRHRDALQHLQHALSNVDHGLLDTIPADLLAVDLRDALYHLGTITGDITSDELLHNIFSRFCIGK